MKPTKILLFILLLAIMPMAYALTVEDGTILNYDCGGSCNVTWTFDNNISMDSLTVYDNAVKFGDQNISIIPATGTEINISIISWSETSNSFDLTGEGQTVTYAITNGNLYDLVYGSVLSESTFTALTSQTAWYYTVAYEEEACDNYVLALGQIMSSLGVIVVILVAGFVMFAITNGTLSDLQTLITLIFSIALAAVVIAVFLSITLTGIC